MKSVNLKVWVVEGIWYDLLFAGGLTGFEVAKDLMKINFSPPSEAPEEFRALNFLAPPAAKGQSRPALLASAIYSQGTTCTMCVQQQDLCRFLHRFLHDTYQSCRCDGHHPWNFESGLLSSDIY